MGRHTFQDALNRRFRQEARLIQVPTLCRRGDFVRVSSVVANVRLVSDATSRIGSVLQTEAGQNDEIGFQNQWNIFKGILIAQKTFRAVHLQKLNVFRLVDPAISIFIRQKQSIVTQTDVVIGLDRSMERMLKGR